MAFVTSDVEHWPEQEIAQWVHYEVLSRVTEMLLQHILFHHSDISHNF